jgi:ferritin
MDPQIEKALNLQINNELKAWYNYLAMATWFEALHLNGFAAFMESQAREEQSHAHRLFRYVLDRGGKVELAAISPPDQQFSSIEEVFTRSVEQEQSNTRSIYELYEVAKRQNDYATIAAVQWFLDEQVEEEKVMSEALGLIRFAGSDKAALLALNRQYADRPAESEADGEET